MTISIVIPTYNGAQYIEQALLSALNQSRPANEIIVSDDNSTDDTIKICKKYSDKIKIHINHNGPSGFVNGWNNALSLASGDLISILHQDDILALDFIEEINKAIDIYPDVKQFVTPCNYIDENGYIIRQSGHLSYKIQRYTGTEYNDIYILNGKDHINRCPGVVTHRDIFEKCKYRSEAGHIADDDFFIRVGNFTDIVCIHKPLAFYREHSSSETGHLDYLAINLRLLDNHAFQINQFKYNPILSARAKDYIRKEECKYIRRVFIGSIKNWDWKYTLKALRHAFRSTLRDKGRNIPLLFSRHK